MVGDSELLPEVAWWGSSCARPVVTCARSLPPYLGWTVGAAVGCDPVEGATLAGAAVAAGAGAVGLVAQPARPSALSAAPLCTTRRRLRRRSRPVPGNLVVFIRL